MTERTPDLPPRYQVIESVGGNPTAGDSTTNQDERANPTSTGPTDPHDSDLMESVGVNIPTARDGTPLSPILAETVLADWRNPESLPVRPGASAPQTRGGSEELRLMSLIAKGGQGEIWEALQTSLGRLIVVKKSQGDADTRVAFLKEACLSAQLDHPNIAPVYHLEFIPEPGEGKKQIPLLAMKKVSGKSWKEKIAEDRKDSSLDRDDFLARHVAILLMVMNAVDYAHSKGIIHRDLKPGQVMLGDYGEVYLLDWGLALYLGQTAGGGEPELAVNPDRMFTLDSASNPSGTPAYMAPEQMLENVERLGFHTDIYLLGAILYELLAGTPPHMARTQSQAMELARVNNLPPIPADAPPLLRDLAMRCLETNPGDRPASVRRMRETLDAWLSQSERRSESQRLTGDMAPASFAGLGYTALSEHARNLSVAEREWPANPAITPLRDRLMEAFVDTALGRGDLIVAQVQAGRVSDPRRARALGGRIEEGRRRLARSIPRPRLVGPGRITILVGWTIVVALFVVGVVTQSNRALTTEVDLAVSSLAEAAARSVAARDVSAVAHSGEIYSPEFQRLYNQVDLIRRTNRDVGDVYVLRPNHPENPALWRVVVHTRPVDFDLNQDGIVSAAERGYGPGDVFDASIPLLGAAFGGTGATVTRREDDSGRFIVGLAPVIDWQRGGAVALIGVEMPRALLARKTREIHTTAFLGGVTILVLGWLALLAFFHSRNLVLRARKLAETVEKQNRELAESDLYLG